MKISDVIKELTLLRKKHGDIEVQVYARESYCCYDGDDYHCCSQGMHDGYSADFSIEEAVDCYTKPKKDQKTIIGIIGYN